MGIKQQSSGSLKNESKTNPVIIYIYIYIEITSFMGTSGLWCNKEY